MKSFQKRMKINHIIIIERSFLRHSSPSQEVSLMQKTTFKNSKKCAIRKAQYEGLKYYDNAVAVEPKITELVKRIARTSGTKLIGLNNRIKGKDRFLEKIKREYMSGCHYKVKDVLRYTMLAEPEELVSKTISSIHNFENNGANVYQLKNMWLNTEIPYNGINAFF